MKSIKNMLAIVLALCMAFSLAACSDSQDSGNETTGPETTAAPVQTTEAPVETTVDDGKVLYTVTVVDEAGNPIPGAMVQLCQDTCFPGATNEEGVAQFSVLEADYKVSFLSLPAGYTYSTEEEAFYFADGSTELTITLKSEG